MANRRFIDFPIASTVGDTDIILIWQGGANKQTTKATFLSGLPENLDELNDVAISGLTNGQILRYDSVTGKWENTDQGNLDLNDLNDVSIVSPSNGQVLVYNSSTSKWENSSGGFVPYVGAVTTVDLGAQGLRAGYVRFDTTVAGVPQEQGLMFWDADDETVDIILNGYTMKIGEDLFYPVKNQTGSTIAKGVAVRFNGTIGASGRLLIAPFIADGSVPSSRFMGVTAEEILNGEDGKVLYFGRVRGINTDAFNEGDILYASTTVAGGYQTAIPLPPNNIVEVAAVISKSPTVGTIFVRPTLGSNINKDEGVKITSVADKNLLQYQSGTALWENKTLAQVLGGTSAQFVKGDGSLDSTSYGTGTVTSVGLSSATSGVTIGSSPVTTSGTITLAIATASGSQNGLLSSSDWTTFNNKQNALTNPVTGTGTTNYLPKFTGSTTIGNSQIFDNGTNVGIGTSSVSGTYEKLAVAGGISIKENTNAKLEIGRYNTTGAQNSYIKLGANSNSLRFTNNSDIADLMELTNSGNLIVGNVGLDNGARLQVSGVSASSALSLRNTTGGTLADFIITENSGLIVNSYEGASARSIDFRVANSSALLIASTGAATFSSSVTANGMTLLNSGGTYLNYYVSTFLIGRIGNVDTNDMYYDSTFGGNHYFRTGTGGTTSPTTKFTITSSGNVGIGTTTPQVRLHIYDATAVRFDMQDNTNTWANLIDNSTGQYRIRYASGAINPLCITTGGNVLIGTTALPSSTVEGIVFTGTSSGNRSSSGTSTAAYNHFLFYNGNGLVGYIYTSGSSTYYITSSDYRLKEDLKEVKGLEKINAINVYDYKWKTSNERMDGVLAHELAEILPYAVIGDKDGEQMQGVDYSKIVPLLIQSIKELKQEIDTLKN